MVKKKWESGQIYVGPFENDLLTRSGVDQLRFHPFSREFGYLAADFPDVTVKGMGILLPC